MWRFYPTMEDMKIDQVVQEMQSYVNEARTNARAITSSAGQRGQQAATMSSALHGSRTEYMGFKITPDMIAENNQLVAQNNQVAQRFTSTGQSQVAPVTGNDAGMRRAEIRQGIREVVLCKGPYGKMGLTVQAINEGLFVAIVHSNTPAALAGLRFGDQILQINGKITAGWDTYKARKFLRKALPQKVIMAICDRPFERTITMHKGSAGTAGFFFNDNKITTIVKDSSAARNGLLTGHHMVEVNGQNVVGLKSVDIKAILVASPRTLTLTIIPSFVYNQILRNLRSSLEYMDHSIPDL